MRKRHLQLLVNPTASTTNPKYQKLLVEQLKQKHQIEVLSTEYPGHAKELARACAEESSAEALLVLGGDGTVNQAAGGLAGSELPLLSLPGGSTSVFARSLGYQPDWRLAIQRTEHVLDNWKVSQIDLGYVDQQPFLFAAGCGLDAQVTKQVDSQPALKAAFRAGFFTWSALHNLLLRYSDQAENVSVCIDGAEYTGSTVLVQNGPMYSYWGSTPLVFNPEVDYSSGTLGCLLIHGIGIQETAELLYKAVSGVTRLLESPNVSVLPAAQQFSLVNLKPMPLQVDGDYLGDHQRAEFSCRPGCVSVLGD